MFEVLSAYLEVTASPEQKMVCLKACHALSEAGYSDHEFLIDQELAIADALDSDLAVNLMDGKLKPIYQQQLAEFGVTLNESARLEHYVDIFEGLVNLDNYEDIATIYAMCDSSDGNVAAIADVLPLVGAFKSEDYLTLIDHVDDSLVDRIASLYDDQPDITDIPVPLVVDRARQRVERFMGSPELSSGHTPIAIQEAMQGGRLGMPLAVAIENHLATLAEIPPPRLAVELVAFVAVSDVYETAMETELAKILDMLGLDYSAITITSVQIKRLLSQV